MALNYLRKMPSFNTVSTGATSSVLLPRGPTYQALILAYGTSTGGGPTEATMKAEIGEIRLLINGVIRFRASATRVIDILMKYYKIPVIDGRIVIPLARPWMRTLAGEDNPAWGTRNVDTFGIEVDLVAGAHTPTLEVEAWQTPVSRDLGNIIEVHSLSFQAGVAGIFEISTLPRGNGDLVAAHFFSSQIQGLELDINQVQFNNATLATSHYLYQWSAAQDSRTPQTDYAHIDALLKDRLDDALPLRAVEDFRVKLDMAGAGTVPILMETLNAPLGLPQVTEAA